MLKGLSRAYPADGREGNFSPANRLRMWPVTAGGAGIRFQRKGIFMWFTGTFQGIGSETAVQQIFHPIVCNIGREEEIQGKKAIYWFLAPAVT